MTKHSEQTFKGVTILFCSFFSSLIHLYKTYINYSKLFFYLEKNSFKWLLSVLRSCHRSCSRRHAEELEVERHGWLGSSWVGCRKCQRGTADYFLTLELFVTGRDWQTGLSGWLFRWLRRKWWPERLSRWSNRVFDVAYRRINYGKPTAVFLNS